MATSTKANESESLRIGVSSPQLQLAVIRDRRATPFRPSLVLLQELNDDGSNTQAQDGSPTGQRHALENRTAADKHASPRLGRGRLAQTED